MRAALIVGLPLLTVAVLRLLRDWSALRLGYLSQTWPRTAGQITFAEVQADPDDPAQSTLRVHYAYTVAGEDYVGMRLRAMRPRATRETLCHLLETRYPVGSFVKVRYNPADPEEAVLEPGLALADRGDPLALTLGLLIVGGGATLVGLL